MSSLPIEPSGLSRQKDFWLRKLYRLTTFKTGDLNRLASIRRQADYFCALVMFFGLFLTILIGVYFGSTSQALLLGGGLFAASALVALLGEGKPISMYLQGALLALMTSAQIHLTGGTQELHFGFFIILAILLVYRKPWVITTTGLLIIGLHWVFNALQQEGFAVYLFKGELTGLGAVLVHSFYILCSMAIFSFIAQVLKRQAQTAEETAQLLSHFGRAEGVDFRMRAQPDANGELSPLGRVFNDFSENMAFTLGSFKMLSLDIRELNAVAQQLQQGNTLRFEQVTTAATDLREFIVKLGKQTEQVQSVASDAKLLKDDCFDLVTEMTQSIEQLSRISKQTYEANRDIQALAADEKLPMSGEMRNKLMVIAASLDHLTERTQTLGGKFDTLRGGVNAADNQAVQLEHSINQILQDGHSNQRKGWEVLGTMEQLQVNAQEAFAVLNNTVDTIVRADAVISDMEKRFSRFDV